jgi:hypothetical protein
MSGDLKLKGGRCLTIFGTEGVGGSLITTDNQVRRLLKMSKESLPLSTLAVKAGMDIKTARKYLNSGRLPSQIETPRI